MKTQLEQHIGLIQQSRLLDFTQMCAHILDSF